MSFDSDNNHGEQIATNLYWSYSKQKNFNKTRHQFLNIMKKQFSLILLSLTFFSLYALPAQAAKKKANHNKMCIEFPGITSFICIKLPKKIKTNR